MEGGSALWRAALPSEPWLLALDEGLEQLFVAEDSYWPHSLLLLEWWVSVVLYWAESGV